MLRLVFVAGRRGPVRRASPRPAGSTSSSTCMSTAAASCSSCYAAFRSRRAVDPLTADDEERLRVLLERHGERDSLGYFALRREKSVIWSPTGKAAVTYRVVGGVSLASGDPIGDPEAWPGAIDAWLAEAREHGWMPGGDGRERGGGHGLRPARPGRAGTRRRGDRRDRRVHPGGARDADRAAGVQPGAAGRLHGADPAPRGHPRRRDGRSCCSAPTSGATGRPSAGSAWRWAGSATPPTGGA